MTFQNPHHVRLLAELGIKGSKIPADFAVMLRGVALYAGPTDKEPFALVSVTVRESNSGGTRRSRVTKHRVFVQCNDCMRWIPAGRLWQHGLAHRWFTIGEVRLDNGNVVGYEPLTEKFGKMKRPQALAVYRALKPERHGNSMHEFNYKVIECGRR